MSQTAIVQTGEQFFIKQLSKSQPIILDRVIFANIGGINGDTEIDLNGSMPDVSQIVHTAPVTQSGLLNDKTVVYSVILDTSVGDFSFNYIGLANAETNTLCLVMHTDLTKKIKTVGQRQGNTITESMWLEIDNASESTGITVNAQTWQIDYSKRLAGEDERIRLTNYDLYNRLAIHSGFEITKNGNQLTVSSGLAYVAGLRVDLDTDSVITVENNQSLYIDAFLAGVTTGEWVTNFNLLAGTNLRDYHDGNFQHYVERIASIDEDGNLRVIKPKIFITNHNLNSSTNSTAENEAATPLAVKKTYDLASNAVQKTGDKMTGELCINGEPVLTRRSYGVGISTRLGDQSIDSAENCHSGFLYSQQQTTGVTPFECCHIFRSAVDDSIGDIAIDGLTKRAKFRGVTTDANNKNFTGDYGWTEFITTENIYNFACLFRGFLSDRNLNDIRGRQHGIYFQNSNKHTSFERNYPATDAGALSVQLTQGDGVDGCVQIYSLYKDCRQFIRTYRGSEKRGTWSPWVEQITTANINAHIPAPPTQIWHDVLGQRSVNTFYTNTTGRTIFVMISMFHNWSSTEVHATLTINGLDFFASSGGSGSGSTKTVTLYLPIPAGCTYKLSGIGNLTKWFELR